MGAEQDSVEAGVIQRPGGHEAHRGRGDAGPACAGPEQERDLDPARICAVGDQVDGAGDSVGVRVADGHSQPGAERQLALSPNRDPLSQRLDGARLGRKAPAPHLSVVQRCQLGCVLRAPPAHHGVAVLEERRVRQHAFRLRGLAPGRAIGGVVGLGACGALWTLLSIVRDSRPGRLVTGSPIVVFGARVGSRGPSQALRARVDRAAELSVELSGAPLVCCGTEAEIGRMRALLEARHVPSRALLECHAASTRDSVKALRRMDSVDGRIVAVSSPYHMHRIRIEARRNGLNIVGAPSRIGDTAGGGISARGMMSLSRLHLRELVATWWYAASSLGR